MFDRQYRHDIYNRTHRVWYYHAPDAGLEIMTTYATQGFTFGFSSNWKFVERPPFALRVARAYQYQVESAAYGAPVLTTAAFAGLQLGGAETTALLFVIGRAAFAVLYYTGILLGNLSTFYIAYGLMVSL